MSGAGLPTYRREVHHIRKCHAGQRAVWWFESEEIMVHIGKLLEPPAPGAGVENFDRRREAAERHANKDAELPALALFGSVGNFTGHDFFSS